MKSLIKQNKVGSCMYFVVGVAIALSFFGCVRYIEVVKEVYIPVPEEKPFIMIPLTDNIITEVGGMDNTPRFQYYLSKTIFLSLGEDKRDSKIDDDGRMIRIGSSIRENVIIVAHAKGIIPDQSGSISSNWNYINIVFEKHEGDPAIQFSKQGYGSNARYEIVYADVPTRKINYGGIDYFVSFHDPEEEPYLMIAIEETVTPPDIGDSRTIIMGLTLDQR